MKFHNRRTNAEFVRWLQNLSVETDNFIPAIPNFIPNFATNKPKTTKYYEKTIINDDIPAGRSHGVAGRR